MTVGDRIRLRRMALGLSLRDLSDLMEYDDHSTIARIEKNIVKPTHTRIEQFAKALNVSVEYLTGEESANMNENEASLNVGDRVKKRRIEIGLSQEELAIKMGYQSRTSINKIENGRPVTQKIAIRLANALGVSPAYLMGLGEEQESDSRNAFASNLRMKLAKCGKSRQTVSQEIGVSYSTFSEWCNGRKYPRIEKIELLAQYFGVSVSELVGSNGIDGEVVAADSRAIFSENLRFYMAKSNRSRKEVSEAIGVSYFTFSDWCNGKKYPRIEKLEALANYFDISVPELVGEKKTSANHTPTPKTDKQEMLDIILRLHTDEVFLKIVEKMSALDNDKLKALQRFLSAFGE